MHTYTYRYTPQCCECGQTVTTAGKDPIAGNRRCDGGGGRVAPLLQYTSEGLPLDQAGITVSHMHLWLYRPVECSCWSLVLSQFKGQQCHKGT